jgi:biopolymer transport protein ExbB/TolQ
MTPAIGLASPTEIPVALTGLAGLVVTVAFYAFVVPPLEATYFGQLFAARGWVPYGIAVLAAWSLVMLGVKARRVAEQRRCLDEDLLPAWIDASIHLDNAHVFASYLRQQAASLPRSFLVGRLLRAVEDLAAQRTQQTVVEQLLRQSEADANSVDSSYTTLRVFIWAIPILGFIGTVLGIATAVGAFSDTVSAAVDIDLMKQSIGSVATGLGIAFDTTLLALVTSIVLMLPMSWLQKFEEELLGRIDEYCDQQLARRLGARDGSDPGPPEANAQLPAESQAVAELGALGVSASRSLRQLDGELARLSQTVAGLTQRLAESDRDRD